MQKFNKKKPTTSKARNANKNVGLDGKNAKSSLPSASATSPPSKGKENIKNIEIEEDILECKDVGNDVTKANCRWTRYSDEVSAKLIATLSEPSIDEQCDIKITTYKIARKAVQKELDKVKRKLHALSELLANASAAEKKLPIAKAIDKILKK